MTDGELLTKKLLRSVTFRVNGGSGHKVTSAALHSGLWSIDNVQSLRAYRGSLYAYGQRTILRKPNIVAGHSILTSTSSTLPLG